MRTGDIRRSILLLIMAAAVGAGCDDPEEIPLPTQFSAEEVVSMEMTRSGEKVTFIRQEDRQWFRHSQGHQHTHFSGAAPFLTLYLAPTGSTSSAYYARTSTNDQVFVVSRQRLAPLLELLSLTTEALHEHG